MTRPRRLGGELELFLTKDNQAATPQDWIEIIQRAEANGYTRITDPYSGFALGAAGERGWFILDNNCAIVELVSLPHTTLDATMANLRHLLDFFQDITPEFKVHWCAQYEAPDQAEYWKRTVSTGLYAIVRHQDWGHWRLMNSLAFQPAIDIDIDEITTVLRTLYLSAPLFAYLYGGSTGETSRLKNWLQAIPHSEIRTGIPQFEIKTLDDYVKNLLALPAFVMANALDRSELIYFDQDPSAREVMFNGADARRLNSIGRDAAPDDPAFTSDPVHVRGRLSNFYGVALPFWHARLVFATESDREANDQQTITTAIEGSDKLYVELRHIGTPSSMTALHQIYAVCLALVERAGEIEPILSSLISWEEARVENRLAVEQNILGPKSRQIHHTLQEIGLFRTEETS